MRGVLVAGLSISKAWDETRATLAEDGKLLATVAAAMFLLPQVVVGLVSGQGAEAAAPNGSQLLLMAVAGLIGLVGQLAIAWMAIRSGASVGESIRHAFGRTLPFLGAMLLIIVGFVILFLVLAILLMLVGAVDVSVQDARPRDVIVILVAMFIPLLFVAVRLMPTVPVAAAEKLGPIGILKRSWALTSGHFGRLVAFILLFLVAALVVAMAIGAVGGLLVNILFGSAEPFSLGALVLALLVGLLQAALVVVYVVMLARIYIQLAGDGEAEASVPTSGS
jgi:hypothetical protein